MKGNIRNERISARISRETKDVIQSNNLSYGDALEIVANMLQNEKSLMEYEYNKLKSENATLMNMIKANEQRMKEIEDNIGDCDGYDLNKPSLSREVQNHIERFEKERSRYGSIDEYIALNDKLIKRRCQQLGLSNAEFKSTLKERYEPID